MEGGGARVIRHGAPVSSGHAMTAHSGQGSGEPRPPFAALNVVLSEPRAERPKAAGASGHARRAFAWQRKAPLLRVMPHGARVSSGRAVTAHSGRGSGEPRPPFAALNEVLSEPRAKRPEAARASGHARRAFALQRKAPLLRVMPRGARAGSGHAATAHSGRGSEEPRPPFAAPNVVLSEPRAKRPTTGSRRLTAIAPRRNQNEPPFADRDTAAYVSTPGSSAARFVATLRS